MGQFKPMVKMMTTEPSVELKLKKGGKVAKKADGGMMGSPMSAADIPPAMPARGGMMGAGAPMKPSLAMRRRAMRGMPSGAGPAGPVGSAASMPAPGGMPAMKKGGKAKHDDAAQDRAMIKKAMAGKKFASGGAIPSETTSGSPATTIMHQAKADNAPAKTGGVKKGNAGGFKKGGMTKKMATGGVVKGQAGYATGGEIPSRSTSGSPATTIVDTAKYDNAPADTGGVRLGNAGGFKRGGATKKHFATGGSVNSTGSAVAMPQGRKPAPKPVAINELAGTYKSGGRVAPGNRALQAVSEKENAPAMRAAKAMSNEKYGPASKMKLKGGGDVDLSRGAYDKSIGPDADDMDMARSIRGFPGKVFDKVKGVAKDLFSTMPKADSVTKTKESVTVTPAKKRGGSVKC
jgi:hypothetical protein